MDALNTVGHYATRLVAALVGIALVAYGIWAFFNDPNLENPLPVIVGGALIYWGAFGSD